MIWSFFSINSFCLWIFFRIRFVKCLTRNPEKFTKMLHSNSASHDREFFQEFVMQLLYFFSRFVHFYWLFLNITTIDGNGAEFFQSPNFKRHLIKRISDFFQIKSWNRLVSVLAGKSITTTPPLLKITSELGFWFRVNMVDCKKRFHCPNFVSIRQSLLWNIFRICDFLNWHMDQAWIWTLDPIHQTYFVASPDYLLHL